MDLRKSSVLNDPLKTLQERADSIIQTRLKLYKEIEMRRKEQLFYEKKIQAEMGRLLNEWTALDRQIKELSNGNK